MRFEITTTYDVGDKVITPDDPEEVGTIRYITFDEQTGEGLEEYKVEYTVRWTSTYQGKPIETTHQAPELTRPKATPDLHQVTGSWPINPPSLTPKERE